eukprot:1180847-Prorocentrum_minimum.AAC.3
MMPGDGSPLCSGEHHCARVPGEVRDAAREQPHGRGAQLHARQHQPHLRASQALHRAEPGGEERRAHPDGAEVAPVASRVRQAENGRRIVSEVGQRAAREEVVEQASANARHYSAVFILFQDNIHKETCHIDKFPVV